VDINRTEATAMSPKMAADAAVVAGGSDIGNVGSGPVVRFDTRDFPENAFEGVLLQGSYATYRSKGAAQALFQVLDLDYRHYLPLPSATLAWNVRARHGFGNVPWTELGGVGSPYDLRGYRWGRYRQRAVAYGIVEYRLRFSSEDSPLGRHGAVAWIGVGTLGVDYAHLEGTLPNVGVGYRLVVQGRLNARLDVGQGRGERAMYFNFSEAF
jgi:hemolysin activation/secretion protein